MSEVFVCEKGQLTTPSKKALREAGIVVAEVGDIARCQFVRSSEVVAADDLLWAAVDAVCLRAKSSYGAEGQAQRERLAHNLLKVIDANRQKLRQPTATASSTAEADDE